ncbi:hypothetical protein PSECIP111951_03090 [Pseudoalteromonas holothuriae]|uniref:Uncharacterized protein n=1 Tax=Pseudoalteromonas holothuriae TaxID=2963714 RepID=A0A9W4W4Q0_9GAMM|nr:MULTISPECIES: hypothetical protein [unclassified Pseudoalteromonas]CAH9059547.1 hypothetical protein PSECIP111854_02428 [Pseudoalteromonas sp. CIP111854]CAH9064272.1 hypothetical protein PSECIP111951_03090 [Pseudoalteromonas sp. CIP111951]
MIWFLLSLLGAVVLYIEAVRKGMPIKRWVFAGLMCGPCAWYLLSVHYRRLWLRNQISEYCMWRA